MFIFRCEDLNTLNEYIYFPVLQILFWEDSINHYCSRDRQSLTESLLSFWKEQSTCPDPTVAYLEMIAKLFSLLPSDMPPTVFFFIVNL